MCNKIKMILLERDELLEKTHKINELKKISNTKSVKYKIYKILRVNGVRLFKNKILRS